MRRDQTVGPAVVAVTLLLGWQGIALWFGDFVVASPWTTLVSIARGVEEGWLLRELWLTALETIAGYGLAVGGGLLIGVWLGLSRWWREALEPILLSVYSLPKVTLYPLFLFMLGLGVTSKMAFGAFHGVFPVALFAATGVASVRPVLLRLGRSLGLGPWRSFVLIIAPAALPTLVAGLRIGFSVTFLGVVLGEMFAARHGLGYELMQAMTLHAVPRIFAIVAVLIAIALVVNGGFLILQARLAPARGRTGARS